MSQTRHTLLSSKTHSEGGNTKCRRPSPPSQPRCGCSRQEGRNADARGSNGPKALYRVGGVPTCTDSASAACVKVAKFEPAIASSGRARNGQFLDSRRSLGSEERGERSIREPRCRLSRRVGICSGFLFYRRIEQAATWGLRRSRSRSRAVVVVFCDAGLGRLNVSCRVACCVWWVGWRWCSMSKCWTVRGGAGDAACINSTGDVVSRSLTSLWTTRQQDSFHGGNGRVAEGGMTASVFSALPRLAVSVRSRRWGA